VSNLHEQMSRWGHLGITGSPQYGAQQHRDCRCALIAIASNCYLG
jgi:hypothetical protein